MFQRTAGVSVLVTADLRPPVEWPDHSISLLFCHCFSSSLHPPAISVSFLLLYGKMLYSLSAIRSSLLLRVSATIFIRFSFFLLLSLSPLWSILSMKRPTFSFDLFHTKARFTCFFLCRGHRCASCRCVLC